MTVPEDYEAGASPRIDAENDLNPLEWAYRTIVDVDLVEFDNEGGGVDRKVRVTVDPPVGKTGVEFVCNRTRERALAKATGSTKPNEWIGHLIAIRQGTTSFRGKDHRVVEVASVSPSSLEKPENPHILKDGEDILPDSYNQAS